MKVLVLGYFGHVTNQLDGQTVRTRNIYSLLKEYTKEEITYFDTQTFQKSKLDLVGLLVLLAKSDVVVYISAQKNLKYLFPLIYVVTSLFRTRLAYVAVGGWLFGFLKRKPLHRYMLSKIKAIYVQTENLYFDLKKYKFKNVSVLNNFRLVSYPYLNLERSLDSVSKLVFMARVHPLKGVDLLFDLKKELDKAGLSDVCIDIYGPVFNEYESLFFDKLKNSSVRYCGIVDPSEIYSTLQDYDLMLFPTKYYTEGFPGTILDAYISGLPVVASKWLNAAEFVDDGKTGFIVEFDNDQQFVEKVVCLMQDPHKLLHLKSNVIAKRDDYSADKAWEVLRESIYDVG